MKVQEDRWYLLRWKERSLKVGTYKWNWTRMVLKKCTDRGFLFSSLLLLHVNSVFREDLRLLMMSREVESGLLRVGSYKWSWTRIVWMKYPDGEYISWTWTLYALKACSVKVWYCWWCLGEGKKGWWRSKGVRRWGGEEVRRWTSQVERIDEAGIEEITQRSRFIPPNCHPPMCWKAIRWRYEALDDI